MSKTYKIVTVIGMTLALYCLSCRYLAGVADAYAVHIYPRISDALSLASSVIAYPIQEMLVVLLIVVLVAFVVVGCRRKWGAMRIVCYELQILLWVYVWFYMSWCNNYSRSSILTRTQTTYTQYDEPQFIRFLYSFTDSVNAAWTLETMTDTLALEAETKQFYAQVPARYGLAKPRSWHHPKPMLFNRLYSAVGVQGFMAPLLAESCVNADLLPDEYPFVYAHEYSHLLGVSNEAEAHWWAFQRCKSSRYKSVRYSGYREILPHVMINARRLLTEEEYVSWQSQLRPEVINDLKRSSTHWQALRSTWLDDLQSGIYDLFLKSNRIESGRKNYSEVVQLLLSLENLKQ